MRVLVHRRQTSEEGLNDTSSDSNCDAQQRRRDADARLRRLPEPAGGDNRRSRDRDRRRLSPDRHRRRVRQRARGGQGDPRLRGRPRRGVRHDEAVVQRLRLRRGSRRLRGLSATARRRLRRPLPAASARSHRLRRDGRGVQGDREDALGRPDSRDRRVELQRAASREPDAANRGRACDQSGRAAPVLHAAAAASSSTRSTGSRPRRGRRSAASTCTGQPIRTPF